MKVILLGTGVAIPWDSRTQSSILLQSSSARLLLDCGAGALHRLNQAQIDPTSIDAVLLTHLHLDHTADFLPLIKANWLLDHNCMNLYGPPGTGDWWNSLLMAYPYMRNRVDMQITEIQPGEEFQIADLDIQAIFTKHSIPSQGYCLETNEGTVVYSGDTEPVREIRNASMGADLLIHECSFPDGMAVTNHTTPRWLGEVMKGTAVGKIVLTHLYPQTSGHFDQMVKSVRLGAGVPVVIANELDLFEV